MGEHVAVWTGNEMIVWQNDNEGGARFNPVTGSWKVLPPVKGPDRSVTALWTGHEVLLWGGIHGTSEHGHLLLDAGGVLYDPIVDSWRMVPPPPPSMGWESAVVWTGKEMIVWGGDTRNPERSSNSFSGKGARYDPELDRWTSTSMVGAPGPRAQHLGVWTGTELVIWGGYGYEGEPLTGRRYNPATDTWRGMSQAGPWVGGTPGIWSGREMIVFTNPTSAYNPVTDTWRAFPTTLAPFQRAGATYTMTGDFLFVWGGWEFARNRAVNTGSRFHVPTDTWVPLSTISALQPRQNHTAVWTSDSLIVWGGGTTSRSATGAIYSPESDFDRDGATLCEGDCDDANGTVHPGAIELPGNGLDEDCDGALLCDPDAARTPGEFVRCFARECKLLGDVCDDIPGLPTNSRDCGNGVRNGHEICDAGDLGGKTCESLGYDSGTLGCNASCDGFDESGCTTVCGNGERAGREICDGADLAGQTCQSLGFDGGMLMCHRTCMGFDQGLCTSACGDDVLGGTEACDGSDLGGRTCQSLGFDGGILACDAACGRLDTSGCTTFCGNGALGTGELCDGDAGMSQTCTDISDNFDEGTPRCLSTCDGLDLSGCARCGDGVKAGTEVCDTTDFGGSSCESEGFEGGSLGCEWDCSGFNINGCIGCGNNRIEGSELCDGYAFRTSCKAMGFDTGGLRCNATCDAVDSSGCTYAPPPTNVCGNGVKESPEACDWLDFGGATCASSGFDGGGELICSYDCKKISTPLCTTICGDGIRKGPEVCDGSDFKDSDNKKCTRFGYDAGAVSCNTSCNGYDLTACSKCGNLIREGSEECEVNDHGGKTCEDFTGFTGGTLLCENCRLHENNCTSVCGDGVASSLEFCDGADMRGSTCQSFYDGSHVYDEGEIACTDGCQYDFTGCRSICGNGERGPRELCDGADLGGRSCGDVGFTGGALTCNATCDGYETSRCTLCGDGVREGTEVCDGADLSGWTCRLLGYTGGVLGCDATCRTVNERACTGN